MVYYGDIIPGTEATAVVIFNTLLLSDARDKEAYIRQINYLADGEVMALLAPWRA